MTNILKTPSAEQVLAAGEMLRAIDEYVLRSNDHYASDLTHIVAEHLGLTEVEGYFFRPADYDRDPAMHEGEMSDPPTIQVAA